MKENNSLSHQLKSVFPLLMKVYIPTALALLVLIWINLVTGIKVSYFTRDPSQIAGVPIYYGIFSNLGILLWCAAASICFFTAAVLRQWQHQKYLFWLLIYSGTLTTFLMLDDLFLFHEEVFPTYLHIPDLVVYAGYGIVVLLFLTIFRKLILQTPFLLLILAFFFFAISIAIDIPDIPFHGQHFFEDGCKLFGIVSWATYFIHVCLRQQVFTAPTLTATATDFQSARS